MDLKYRDFIKERGEKRNRLKGRNCAHKCSKAGGVEGSAFVCSTLQKLLKEGSEAGHQQLTRTLEFMSGSQPSLPEQGSLDPTTWSWLERVATQGEFAARGPGMIPGNAFQLWDEIRTVGENKK